MVRPTTRYAKSGDVHIAYQVVGEGPIDLVFAPWWWNHLETQWDDPAVSSFLNRLASFSRLIVFDQRGTGLSDPISLRDVPTLEEWMDDVRAVMDAASSERATIFGHGDGGCVCILFAATYPDRASSLVLADAYARIEWDEIFLTFTGGKKPATRDEWLDLIFADIEANWGTGVFVREIAPSRAHDETFREQLARLERISVSPGVAAAIQRMIVDLDLRPILPTVSVPTLVVHRKDNAYCPPSWGREVAERIPNARYVEVPGDDHVYWLGATDVLLDEVEAFVTGVRPAPEPDRVLATVLFTDIVASTDRASSLGDREWSRLLDRHDQIVGRCIADFRGRYVDSAGDGVLATFDGPARAIKCACAIRDGLRALGIDVRAGLHTGEIEVVGDDVRGIAVHIGARVSALAGAGEILVSSTVVDLVAGSDLRFEDKGEHELKGVPRPWRIFALQR